MVELEGVSKTYGQATAVNAVTLRVEAGETLAVIGPSGCGKTTLLKLINRLIPASAGRIWVNGVDVTEVDPVKLRRGIGYVIQQVGLLPHLTVGENIAFVLGLMAVPASVRAERAEELVRLVGLPPEYLAKRPQQLSGGQQQRVGVARALAANPAVILMDEPFGAVDPITRQKLQEMILLLQREMRKTILFVTHDIQEAFRLGTRVAIMRDGGLVKVGAPAELIREQDAFVQQLLGRRAVFDFLENIPVSAVLDATVPVIQLGQAVPEATGRWEHILVVDAERRFMGILDKSLALNRGDCCSEANVLPGGDAVDPAASLSAAVQAMLWQGRCWLPVVKGRQLLGAVTFDACARLMRQ